MGVMAEGLLLTLYLGVPIEIWDAVWFASGRGGEPYREAFLHLYHLEIGTMIVDELPVDAVVPISGFETWWAEVVLWLLNPLSTCTEGCPQSQRPVM